MMKSIRKWLASENGVSEAATVIFVLPVIVALVFVMLEAGFNMRSRTIVDNITQDIVRNVALDGGDMNPRTNVQGKSWSQIGLERLNSACSQNVLRCSGTPTFSCTPAVAANIGDVVSCTATVSYATVSPLSTSTGKFDPIGLVMSLGFAPMFTAPISSTAQAVAATGLNG